MERWQNRRNCFHYSFSTKLSKSGFMKASWHDEDKLCWFTTDLNKVNLFRLSNGDTKREIIELLKSTWNLKSIKMYHFPTNDHYTNCFIHIHQHQGALGKIFTNMHVLNQHTFFSNNLYQHRAVMFLLFHKNGPIISMIKI